MSDRFDIAPDPGTDEWIVSEVVRRPIATFHDADRAEEYLRWLRQGGPPTAPEIAAAEADIDAAAAETVSAVGPETGDTASVTTVAAAPLPEPPNIVITERAEATLRALDPTGGDPYHDAGEAFRRLKAGEQLAVVADDLGLKMPVLRSRWARYQQGLRVQAWQPGATVAKPCDSDPPEGWAICPDCRTKFNAERAQRDAKLPTPPIRCAACRNRKRDR